MLTLRDGSRIDSSQFEWAIRIAKAKAEAKELPPAPRTLQKDEWPPNYDQVYLWRHHQIARMEEDPEFAASALEYYRTRPEEFINHWCDTYDPRNRAKGLPARVPLIMFQRQADLVEFFLACIRGQESGLVEKSRDMGATWIACGFACWMWLFWEGSASGFGSRKQELVDRLGDPSSIFEKLRMIIRGLPEFFLPSNFNVSDHLHFMRIISPEMGTSMIGETGDNIGRGGRTLIYFKDESAHYAHPEMIEAALLDNTRSQMDISSVSGLGTIFHRRREAGKEWTPGQKAHEGVTNIFIMDWSDHPEKSREWYERRKAKARADGLLHVFAKEIDRDYSAAVEGVIIPSEYVVAAIDAHKKLGIEPSGPFVSGLDVADGGTDSNAQTIRRGVLAFFLDEWAEKDTASTARRALANCKGLSPVEFNYDNIGIGSGVKSEINNQREKGNVPNKGITFSGWNAGARPLDPSQPIDPKDKSSPTNRDFYANLKAQAWWNVGQLFYKTFRALNEPDFEWTEDDIISISSEIDPNLLRRLQKELSQPTIGRTAHMKLIVNKMPEGTKSPNLADSFVEAFFPWREPRRRASISRPRIIR